MVEGRASGSADAADRTFDFVIVGAGTAGCVLAARLSEDPRNSVCLLEAGGGDGHPFIRVPALVGAAIGSRGLNWGFATEPQANLNGRRIPLPRGRAVGGSGSINGMAYYRGHALDFDDWAAAGARGWSYAELLPYFIRSEDNPDFAGTPYHGTGGPMRVSFVRRPNRLNQAFLQAMQELQFPACPDFNVPEPEGYGYRQATIRDGRRDSSAAAFLRPALARPNLTVVKQAHAMRILFEGRRAAAVQVRTPAGEVRFAAGREVLLAAGALQSPQLLMLSGVGDPERLKAAGVATVAALADVGRHLQDHLGVGVVVDSDDPTSYGISWRALPRDAWALVEYLAARRGAFASNLFETTAYIRSEPGLDRPDMQVVFQPARRNRSTFPLPLGHGFAVNTVQLYPKARGEVRLAGPDPFAAPLIDPHLGEPEDIAVLVRGVRLARRILGSPAFASRKGRERTPGADAVSDEALEAYVRSAASTVHHPAGTCRMGPGPGAVVDPELRVHGLAGLRVVDASVFPRLIGGNTNAGVVAVAEKAADMILGRPAPEPIHLDRPSAHGDGHIRRA